MAQDDEKKLAAEAAAREVQDGMLVGLGTGSTAAHLIAALARRVAEGLRIEAVATSEASAAAAREGGIPVRDFAAVPRLDLAIDGADEIDARLFAIKGAGGAMLREKVVAAAAARMVVIADGTKRVDAIGAAPVPVEVLPFAQSFVVARLRDLGATVSVRMARGATYRTDNGNAVIDCRFGMIDDPRALASAVDAIPGALGHGLFLDEVDAAYVATGGEVTVVERGSGGEPSRA